MASNALISERVRKLGSMYPGYFTLTMATGIIAVGFNILEEKFFSDLFYGMTLVSWVVLYAAYTLRLVRFPRKVFADLTNPRVTFSFFTFVAATSVTGILLHMHGHTYLALLAWLMALLAWSALLYFSFTVLTLLHGERNLNVMDGGWLICIVGTQSLVLLGLKVVPLFGEYGSFVMLGIYMLWWLGLVLYGIFLTLFCYRLFFLSMKIEDYTPLMWVIMGAAAISANAGSTMDLSDPIIHVLYEIHPVVDAMALMSWTLASWWIPLLVSITIWKHWVCRVPVSYDPRQWSVVFPIGMYTVATFQLSLATEFDPLHRISHVMIWAAVIVWVFVMIGTLRRLSAWLSMKEVYVID